MGANGAIKSNGISAYRIVLDLWVKPSWAYDNSWEANVVGASIEAITTLLL